MGKKDYSGSLIIIGVIGGAIFFIGGYVFGHAIFYIIGLLLVGLYAILKE